jgi:hypothetical protein
MRFVDRLAIRSRFPGTINRAATPTPPCQTYLDSTLASVVNYTPVTKRDTMLPEESSSRSLDRQALAPGSRSTLVEAAVRVEVVIGLYTVNGNRSVGESFAGARSTPIMFCFSVLDT